MPQLKQKAGLGFDKVRVLITFGQSLNIHLVPADFLRQLSQVRERGDDFQFLGLCCRGNKYCDTQQREHGKKTKSKLQLHQESPRKDAPRALLKRTATV